MQTFREIKEWLGWTDADPERLAEVKHLIEPHVHRIIDHFYDEVQRHPQSLAVLSGPAQIKRLKGTLRIWLLEVFDGPHNDRYAALRRAIGRRHVQVGLPNRYMFTAMYLIEREITEIIRSELTDYDEVLDSVHRVLMMDLTLMTSTYVEARERQQFDALHTLLIRHLRLSVFLVDSKGIVRSATEASARIVGKGTIVGCHWTQVLPDGLVDAGYLVSEAEAVLKRGMETSLPRVDVLGKDGTTRSFRVHLVPLDHDLADLLVQIEELTDTVAMEARVRRNEALAQLGTLSAAVSHELRNPLAGISGVLQVISRGMEEGSANRGILEKVNSEIQRLNDLVSDLLQFARPGEVTFEEVDLGRLAGETLEFFCQEHTEVEFMIQGHGWAHADPNLVRQILHNLLRNAVDAAGKAGQVSIEVGPGEIRVDDSGAGIRAERRDEIFLPFVTTKTRGTGLGLAISRRNATSMGGELVVSSQGRLPGACFRLTLQLTVRS